MSHASPSTGPPVVVLLGAGASKDAGLRLAVELTKDLRESVEDDLGLRQALGLILGGIAFRRGVDGHCIDSHVPDIETVVKVAQQLADRNNQLLAFYVASWHSSLEKVAPGGDGTIFETLVRRARDILAEKLKTPSKAVRYKYLADVWKLCEPLSDQCPPDVFSLNYDLCLEKALEHERKPYTTGFRDGIWTQQEFDRRDCLRLYKLHGSFGWVRHPETRLLYDRDRALRRDDILILGPETSDELIFGTDNKLQAVQPFLWMVHRFSKAIRAAKYLVTIGYGFFDTYINQMIGYGMAADPLKRLIVVSPGAGDAMIEDAPGMSFYPARTHYIGRTAKKALDEEEAVVAKLTELEKAAPDEDPFDDRDPAPHSDTDPFDSR
jgi:hypothetical protein